jgi:DNA-binding MarR family transcriptional regulator
MRLKKRHNEYLTRGEQAIVDLLIRHERMTGPEIARALGSTPASIKVMINNMRGKGATIRSGGQGKGSPGYRLEGLI